MANSPEAQNFENLPVTSAPAPLTTPPPNPRKRLLLFLPGIIFVLLAVALLVNSVKTTSPPVAPSNPTPTPTPNLEETFNSPWATNSAVIQIDANLDSLETQLTQIDLKLIPLLPPSITLDLKFETEPGATNF